MLKVNIAKTKTGQEANNNGENKCWISCKNTRSSNVKVPSLKVILGGPITFRDRLWGIKYKIQFTPRRCLF